MYIQCHSSNIAYLQQNWRKVLIFVQVFHSDANTQFIIKYTLLYMTSVSKTIQQNLENPAMNMSVEEEELILPYVFLKYQRKYKEEGLEAGLAKGREEGMLRVISNFIKHHPELSDEALAASFEVDITLIKTARAP